MTRPRYPIAFKFGAAASVVLMAALGAVLVGEYLAQRQDIEDTTGQRLRAIAATAALTLDGDLHQTLQSDADVGGAAYERLREELTRIQLANGLEEHELLTLRRTATGYAFVIFLQARVFGGPYRPPQQVREALDRVFDRGDSLSTSVYADGAGQYVSAFAPLRDRRGTVVGVLEVDNDVSLLWERLRQRMLRTGAVGAAALVGALVLMAVMARRLTRAISRLAFAMQEVEAGRYDTDLNITSEDEIGVLARVFLSMRRGLRERLALLRFVPRHTRKIISDQVRTHPEGAHSFLPQKRDLAVLFSDIRGFTTMSDELPPGRIIAMLNIYLRHESEIIERHEGNVDKFIGDAVMAIFEGPHRFENAADAALEIQATFKAANAAGAFERPVEVGIGIAGGDVVMGGVGSEERMELAVIGSLVNLASRLTSTAGRSEIVVSERVFESLAPSFRGERREKAQLKGFAEPQGSYTLLGRSGTQGGPP